MPAKWSILRLSSILGLWTIASIWRKTARNHRNKGRTAGVLLGGAAIGAIAGRLAPPLISELKSALRTRAGGDPFKRLIADHRRIVKLLDDMVNAPPTSRIGRTRLFLALKRRLAKHAMAEEDVVYPIVRKQDEDQGKHLYDEHADMKTLLYEVESRLMAGDDWGATARQLRDLIRSHIAEEENTVFPALRRRLSESALPKISGRISREEAVVI